MTEKLQKFKKMDLQEIYKKESGYDVGRYNIDNTNYYSEDYVECLEKQLHIGSVVRNYTEKEIRQQAKDFYNKWLPKWEKYCEVCGARNCKYNDSCIKCNCQF